MPPQSPPSTFDYYKELEVERTASLAQITSSYRNLARIHHPDRNFGREQEATAKFQRIQQAYEILSNPTERRRYDHSTSSSTSSSSSFWDNSNFDGDDLGEHRNPSSMDDFSSQPSFHESFFSSYGSHASNVDEPADGERPGNAWERLKNRRQQQARERERQHLHRYRERCRQQAEALAERRRCEEEQKAERDASRAAKQATEEAAKAYAREEEKQSQEERWNKMGAISEDEKLCTCLHSDFCTKLEQKKKFKCTACSGKRGMIAFECPHCSALLCQLCVTNFSTQRCKLAKAKTENPAASSTEDSTSISSTAGPSYAEDPFGTEPQASSSKQPSSQDEHGKSKEKKKYEPADKSSDVSDIPLTPTTDSPSPGQLSESPVQAADTNHDPNGPTSTTPDEELSTCNISCASDADSPKSQAPMNKQDSIADDHGKSDSHPADYKPAVETVQSKQKAEKTSTSNPRKEDDNSNTNKSDGHADQTKGKQAASNKPLATGVVRKDSVAKDKENISPTTISEDVSSASALNAMEEEKTGLVAGESTESPCPEASDQAQSSMSEQQGLVANEAPHEETSQEAAMSTDQVPTTQALQSGHSQPPQAQPFQGNTHFAVVRPVRMQNRITDQMIRPAMERFGAVTSIQMRNKAAHVGFADQQALRRAIAASPVTITTNISVKIVELKTCDICGKLGHVARHCWSEI